MRAWETQYHLIMALGEAGCGSAVRLLERLAASQLAHMVGVAIGDAIGRLSLRQQDISALLSNLPGRNQAALSEGLFRAVALLHHVPARVEQRALLAFASGSGNDSIQFWAAAAAAGWDKDIAHPFLLPLQSSDRDDTRLAANTSLAGTYQDWRPL